MTTEILRAFRKCEPKFKDIAELSKNITEIISKKDLVITEVINIYRLVFQNYSSKRIETNVRIKGLYSSDDNVVVYLNKNGISLKNHSYRNNTKYIDNEGAIHFIKIIKQLKEKELELLPLIEDDKKKELLAKFLEKVNLLIFDKNLEVKLDTDWILYNDKDDKTILVKQVKITPGNIKLDYSGEWMYNKDLSIGLGYQTLNDKILLEQCYEDLKMLLNKYIELETNNLNNANLFLQDIKNKFSKQMIINSLKTKKKEV